MIKKLVIFIAMMLGFTMAPALADFDENNPGTFAALPAHCNPEIPGKCSIQFYGNDRPFVVAWGDSHMVQQIPALTGHTANVDHNLVAFTMGLCPPMMPAASNNDVCAQNARAAMTYIKQKVDAGKRVTVVLGGFWHFYFTTNEGPRAVRAAQFRAGELAMFNWLKAQDVRLLMSTQTPTLPLVESDCTLESDSCPRATMLPDEAAINTWINSRTNLVRRHAIADFKPWLCDSVVCHVNIGDVELYYDVVHLNVALTSRHNPAFRWAVL